MAGFHSSFDLDRADYLATGVERMWRDARLGETSSEIQRLIIRRTLLRATERPVGESPSAQQ